MAGSNVATLFGVRARSDVPSWFLDSTKLALSADALGEA
jgi:hypothetical protein